MDNGRAEEVYQKLLVIINREYDYQDELKELFDNCQMDLFQAVQVDVDVIGEHAITDMFRSFVNHFLNALILADLLDSYDEAAVALDSAISMLANIGHALLSYHDLMQDEQADITRSKFANGFTLLKSIVVKRILFTKKETDYEVIFNGIGRHLKKSKARISTETSQYFLDQLEELSSLMKKEGADITLQDNAPYIKSVAEILKGDLKVLPEGELPVTKYNVADSMIGRGQQKIFLVLHNVNVMLKRFSLSDDVFNQVLLTVNKCFNALLVLRFELTQITLALTFKVYLQLMKLVALKKNGQMDSDNIIPLINAATQLAVLFIRLFDSSHQAEQFKQLYPLSRLILNIKSSENSVLFESVVGCYFRLLTYLHDRQFVRNHYHYMTEADGDDCYRTIIDGYIDLYLSFYTKPIQYNDKLDALALNIEPLFINMFSDRELSMVDNIKGFLLNVLQFSLSGSPIEAQKWLSGCFSFLREVIKDSEFNSIQNNKAANKQFKLALSIFVATSMTLDPLSVEIFQLNKAKYNTYFDDLLRAVNEKLNRSLQALQQIYVSTEHLPWVDRANYASQVHDQLASVKIACQSEEVELLCSKAQIEKIKESKAMEIHLRAMFMGLQKGELSYDSLMQLAEIILASLTKIHSLPDYEPSLAKVLWDISLYFLHCHRFVNKKNRVEYDEKCHAILSGLIQPFRYWVETSMPLFSPLQIRILPTKNYPEVIKDLYLFQRESMALLLNTKDKKTRAAFFTQFLLFYTAITSTKIVNAMILTVGGMRSSESTSDYVDNPAAHIDLDMGYVDELIAWLLSDPMMLKRSDVDDETKAEKFAIDDYKDTLLLLVSTMPSSIKMGQLFFSLLRQFNLLLMSSVNAQGILRKVPVSKQLEKYYMHDPAGKREIHVKRMMELPKITGALAKMLKDEVITNTAPVYFNANLSLTAVLRYLVQNLPAGFDKKQCAASYMLQISALFDDGKLDQLVQEMICVIAKEHVKHFSLDFFVELSFFYNFASERQKKMAFPDWATYFVDNQLDIKGESDKELMISIKQFAKKWQKWCQKLKATTINGVREIPSAVERKSKALMSQLISNEKKSEEEKIKRKAENQQKKNKEIKLREKQRKEQERKRAEEAKIKAKEAKLAEEQKRQQAEQQRAEEAKRKLAAELRAEEKRILADQKHVANGKNKTGTNEKKAEKKLVLEKSVAAVKTQQDTGVSKPPAIFSEVKYFNPNDFNVLDADHQFLMRHSQFSKNDVILLALLCEYQKLKSKDGGIDLMAKKDQLESLLNKMQVKYNLFQREQNSLNVDSHYCQSKIRLYGDCVYTLYQRSCRNAGKGNAEDLVQLNGAH